MGFILSTYKIINDIEKIEKYNSTELKPFTSNTIIEELSPRFKKRVKSIENFMKYQWSWTL